MTDMRSKNKALNKINHRCPMTIFLDAHLFHRHGNRANADQFAAGIVRSVRASPHCTRRPLCAAADNLDRMRDTAVASFGHGDRDRRAGAAAQSVCSFLRC